MDDAMRTQQIEGLVSARGPLWSKDISRILGIPWEDVVDTLPRHPGRFRAIGHTWVEPMNQTCWALVEEAEVTLR